MNLAQSVDLNKDSIEGPRKDNSNSLAGTFAPFIFVGEKKKIARGPICFERGDAIFAARDYHHVAEVSNIIH
jgi:hypothetical protein